MSVVVPAYNAEKTIERIVNQVLGQSYRPAEIIVVDDGSTDKTGEIIDRIANEHLAMVKPIHQLNGGVSLARNTGIAATTGMYITFIDADDEISHDYIKNLMGAIIEDNSDMAVAGYVKLPQGDVELPRAVYGRSQYQQVIMTRNIGVAVCKVYDSRIIKENDITFPVGMKASEDAVFYYRYLMHSRRCSFVDKKDYTYYAPQSGKNYGADLDEKIFGLKSMGDALIALIESLHLDNDGVERLRKRLVLTLNMVLYSIAQQPIGHRISAYSKIEWNKYVKYIHTDSLIKHAIRNNKFKIFEVGRLIRTKCLHQSISDIIS